MSHIHEVIDTDPHYKIDGVTRTIVNVDETKRMLVQGDHNSERLTFEIPRFVDGHDFLECNVVEVHFENEDTLQKNVSASFYTVKDLKAKGESEEENNIVIFSWLVDGDATVYEGTLNFSIHFKCITDDILDYSWNTTTFKGIVIKPCVCSAGKIENKYPSVLTQLANSIKKLEDGIPLKDKITEEMYELYVFDGKLVMIKNESEG